MNSFGHFCGVIVRRPFDRKILVVKLFDKTPAWRIPGGKPEPFETIAMTARRELKEETGLKALSLKWLGENCSTADGSEWIGHLFLCEEFEGVAEIQEPNKIADIDWFDEEVLIALNELCKIDLELLRRSAL